MIIVGLIFLGVCVGSFINALVWRLHKQETSKKKTKKAKYSILNGRSMCPSCQRQLAIKDLAPLVSWLFLKGKCRYCKKPISWQYPVIELLTPLLFIVSYLWWPGDLSMTWQLVSLISWLIILIGFIALTVYDIKWMLLPDKIVFCLFGLAILTLVLQFVLGRPINDIYNLLGAITIGGGIFWLIFLLSQGKWIGGGDVKLGFLLGLIVITPQNAFLMLFIASVLAMLVTTPFLLTKKITKTSKVPFGPFLIISCMIVVLFGSSIINAYKAIFGL